MPWFVDNPETAVGVADRLVTEVMRQRGYPVDDFDQRAADISVDHPQIVDNYRAAHGIARIAAACQHRAAAGGVRALPGAVREVARNPKKTDKTKTDKTDTKGGKRMTTHEHQTLKQ